MSINSRNKGKAYELKLLNELRSFYPEVLTSRNASKLTDDLGVDFVNTGNFAIQAKALERTPPYHDMLQDIEKNFPKKIALIIHSRNYKKDIAVMSKYRFYLLLQHLLILEDFAFTYDDDLREHLSREDYENYNLNKLSNDKENE
jgi:hypothetical protein